MDRSILSDEQFERVAPHLPGKVGDPGRRRTIGCFWKRCSGLRAPWRDLGPRFGLWNSVYRPPTWAEKGVFESLFKLLSPDPATPSGHHRPSTSMAPAQGGTQNQAIGRSRGGLTTKIVALVDALGNLTRFLLLPGQRHDSTVDRGYLRGPSRPSTSTGSAPNSRGVAVIPPKADRVRSIPCDFAMYKWRHLVENFFCDLKQFRRIATRSRALPR